MSLETAHDLSERNEYLSWMGLSRHAGHSVKLDRAIGESAARGVQ